MEEAVRKTDRYDLSIPSTDEANIRKAMQAVCDETGTYPFILRKGKKGMVASFLRDPSVPQYLMQENMNKIVSRIKANTCLITVLMLKKPAMVKEGRLPKRIKEILSGDAEETTESDANAFKKLDEDEDVFYSNAIKQMEDIDYDSFETRKSLQHVVRIQRVLNRTPLIEATEATYHKNGKMIATEGQLKFDLQKLL